MRVLILGGTGEARALAALLATDGRYDVVSSLAGRVSRPALPVGAVRIGGFGGAAGLTAYLRDERIDVVVDATHPFAATISANAARACTDTPLLALRRPGWTQGSDDDWTRVADIGAAAAHVARDTRRDGLVFLTTGRRDLAAFAADDAHDYLVRTVDPPTGPTPARMTLILDRGPYTVAGEGELMQTHGVDVLVTKDSGGAMTQAKLAAARARHLPVVVVERPPLPAGVQSVETPEAAVDWVRGSAGA